MTWNKDHAIGEKALRKFDEPRKLDEGKNELYIEARELLSAFIDERVLKGFAVTPEQWERACLLCGRYCPPFVNKEVK